MNIILCYQLIVNRLNTLKTMGCVKTSTEKTVFYAIFLHLCLLGIFYNYNIFPNQSLIFSYIRLYRFVILMIINQGI